MASEGSEGAASDLEIMGLMAKADWLERAAERAARAAAGARCSLALRAMSRTNLEERGRLFALGQPLSVDLILAWGAMEARLTSREQRRRWKLFKSDAI